MPTEFLLYLLAGAAAGGFINGLAGFGTSLFALVWWLQILPPVQAVGLALVMSVASGVPGVIEVRRSIRMAPLAWFLLPAFLGVPIGLQLLKVIDAGVLKGIVAGLLLVFSVYFLTRRDLPRVTGSYHGIDAVTGFLGGILGAVAGLSGALPTMWIALKDWGKVQRRAVLQPFNVVILGVSAALLAIEGVYDREALIRILIALPVTMTASALGLMVFRRLSDTQHVRQMVVLLLMSGCAIGIKEWL